MSPAGYLSVITRLAGSAMIVSCPAWVLLGGPS